MNESGLFHMLRFNVFLYQRAVCGRLCIPAPTIPSVHVFNVFNYSQDPVPIAHQPHHLHRTLAHRTQEAHSESPPAACMILMILVGLRGESSPGASAARLSEYHRVHADSPAWARASFRQISAACPVLRLRLLPPLAFVQERHEPHSAQKAAPWSCPR